VVINGYIFKCFLHADKYGAAMTMTGKSFYRRGAPVSFAMTTMYTPSEQLSRSTPLAAEPVGQGGQLPTFCSQWASHDVCPTTFCPTKIKKSVFYVLLLLVKTESHLFRPNE